jgi:hypothetical protein
MLIFLTTGGYSLTPWQTPDVPISNIDSNTAMSARAASFLASPELRHIRSFFCWPFWRTCRIFRLQRRRVVVLLSSSSKTLSCTQHPSFWLRFQLKTTQLFLHGYGGPLRVRRRFHQSLRRFVCCLHRLQTTISHLKIGDVLSATVRRNQSIRFRRFACPSVGLFNLTLYLDLSTFAYFGAATRTLQLAGGLSYFFYCIA